MKKKEFEEIESILVDIQNSDDRIEPIERLVMYMKQYIKNNCIKKLKRPSYVE